MASTNKTINYNLSQYLANDKPTYLVDYNSDMNKIDTQMKANSDLAGLAKTEADDLSSRVDGQDVIIGNLNTTVGQHTNDISSLNTAVSTVNTKVGDLTDLNTTDKTDIVSAVNEVNTKIGDLTDLDTTDKSDIVNAVNEVKSDIEKTKGEVLYTGPTTTNFTLSDSVDNYDRIGIVFRNPNGIFCGELIVDSTENTVELTNTHLENISTMLLYSLKLTFSGTNVTYSDYARCRIVGSTSPVVYSDDNVVNKLVITKIIGYKE